MLGTYMPEKRFDMVAVGKVGWQKGGVRGSVRGRPQGVQVAMQSLVVAVRVEGEIFCWCWRRRRRYQKSLFRWTKLRDVRFNIEYQTAASVRERGFLRCRCRRWRLDRTAWSGYVPRNCPKSATR